MLRRMRNRSGCSFGERERAFVIHGILRSNLQERRFEAIGLPVDGDTPLGHRFGPGRLRPRRGPVDFVGRTICGEDRSWTELELGRLRIEYRGRRSRRSAANPACIGAT